MKKLLLAYDYSLTTSGKEHYGIAELLKSFLKEKKIFFKVHKELLTANPIFLLIKFFKLLSDIYKNKEITDFIGYNPINSLFGSICRLLLFRRYRVVFVSVDFTEKRFNNFILDKFYIYLDYLASVFSDETWSCSNRVYEYRNKFIKDDKNFYIPNIPSYTKLGLKKQNTFTIVMVSFLSQNYIFSEILNLLNLIKKKNMNLVIIGDGDAEIKNNVLKAARNLNIEDSINFTGYIPHEEVLKILEKSHLGLALYNGVESYNFWGDSLKIREYTYYELPVITTKNVNNYKEVIEKSLGVCLEDFLDLSQAVTFLENSENYNRYLNSIKEYNMVVNSNTLFENRLNLKK
jgi:glycosyltransferase involved in cell wall biosynthesis